MILDIFWILAVDLEISIHYRLIQIFYLYRLDFAYRVGVCAFRYALGFFRAEVLRGIVGNAVAERCFPRRGGQNCFRERCSKRSPSLRCRAFCSKVSFRWGISSFRDLSIRSGRKVAHATAETTFPNAKANATSMPILASEEHTKNRKGVRESPKPANIPDDTLYRIASSRGSSAAKMHWPPWGTDTRLP